MAARLKERYAKEIAPAIAKEFDIKNPMAVPKLEKIVINMGLGEAIANSKINYTLGIREQLIFPEIDFNKVDKTRGMNISIVTTARDDEQARALLRALGMPFRQ
ncbi:MAG: 50S ribosomal protein L5 [Acidobacteria bacterium]|nr:50S ribosomal protein L5 [Acidobacteriota bacterium]